MVQPADKETVDKLHQWCHSIVTSTRQEMGTDYCPGDAAQFALITGIQMAAAYPEWAVGFLQSIESWPLDGQSRELVQEMIRDMAVSGVSDG